MAASPAYCARRHFSEPISLNPRKRRYIPIKTSRSPCPLCIVSYAYSSISKNDLAGNRLSEQLWQKTLLPGTDAQTDVLYQDNHLAYDALNRLRVARPNWQLDNRCWLLLNQSAIFQTLLK
jgi:hypothetical protein